MFKFIDISLRSRMIVIFLYVAVIMAGIYSASQLPIDAVPDITNVQVMINTKTAALAPEEIEATVTYPIETEISGLPGVDEIRSISKYGLSQVTVVFDEGTDLYFARQLIAERLSNLRGSLRDGISPEMGPVSTGLGEIFMYEVKAKPGSELEKQPREDRLRYLRTIQDWVIGPALKMTSGVAEVDSNGGFTRAIHIDLDPIKMERLGVSVERIYQALENSGVNIGGGYIETDHRRLIVRSLGRFQTLEEIQQIPIRLYALSAPIKLGDIARVQNGNRPRVGATVSDGKETVIGTVLMRIGANARTTAEAAEAKLKEIPIPDDVEIDTLYSRSYLVNSTINTVLKNLMEGAVLVIVILLLILGNLRAAIMVSLAIPISMLFSLSGMFAGKISANLMSLGAIDFGLLVDASVVVIENIVRRTEESEKESYTFSEKMKLILESAREVAAPVTAGLMIIMIVYVPILTLTGIEGKMFRPMAATVLLALGASLLTALTLMPVLASLILSFKKKKENRGLFQYINYVYRPLLTFSLNYRWFLIVPTVIVTFISLFMFTRLGADFIPQLDEGDLVIGMVRNADISLEESVRKQEQADSVIKEIPEVERVFSRMGTPESATDPMGINFADTFVILKKHDGHDEGGRTKAEVYNDISQRVKEILPDQDLSPTQPIEMRFNEMLEGSRADVTLRIFGNDLKKLMDLVDQAQEVIGKIDGVEEVAMDELTALRKTPIIDFRVNHNQLSSYGILADTVQDAFETAMAGKEIGYYYENDIRYPVILRMADSFRNHPESIRRIPVDLPGGGTVPFSKLAGMSQSDQVTTISRYNARRYAAISIYLNNRDVESFVNEAKEKLNASVQLPDKFYYFWGGQYKNLKRARLQIAIILPLTLAAIFMILIRSFNDVSQSILILMTIPLAIVGGIILLYLRGINFSISAAVGFIALTGIAILNGMVLVSFFNQLRKQGMPLRQAVFEGTMTRLRPVLMTALVASLGFIPMAFNTGPGAEVQRPLATVVVGGLVSSTLLTLLLLPTVYLWLESFRERYRNRKEIE